MAVWEYHIDYGVSVLDGKSKAAQIEQLLSTRGNEGWELINILLVDSDEGKQEWLIFKRPMIKPKEKSLDRKPGSI